MDLNVALLTDPRTTLALCRLSDKLAAHLGSSLRLDPHWARPHLTLYMTGFPAEAMDAVRRRVQWLTTEQPRPLLTVTGWSVGPRGALLLEVDPTVELTSLHRAVVEALNPLRSTERAQIWEERRARFDADALERLESVGMPFALRAWKPHFTIGRIEPERADEVAGHLDGITFCGRSPAMGLGGVGPHGTFRELVEAFPFARKRHAA